MLPVEAVEGGDVVEAEVVGATEEDSDATEVAVPIYVDVESTVEASEVTEDVITEA